MTLRRSACWVSLAVVLASVPATAGTARSVEWILAEGVAGPRGVKDLSVEIEGRVLPSKGPLVLGFADVGWTDLMPIHGSEGSISVVRGPLHHRVDAVPGLAGAFIWSSSIGGPLEPGERFAHVWFVAGGSFERTPSRSVEPVGSRPLVRWRTGRGATAISLAGAAREGVTALGAATGTFSASRTVKGGIVGGQPSLCEECSGSWRPPTGRSRAWRTTGSVVYGSWEGSGWPAFAGPRGRWRWAFSGTAFSQTPWVEGAASGDAILAAFAHVGDAWKLFVAR